MIRLEGAKKHYKDFDLDVSLNVKSGYITGLIGANGAGKSTIFKALLGLIHLDSGIVEILGKSSDTLTLKERENIGVVLADSGFSQFFKITDIVPILEVMNYYVPGT